MNRNEFIQAVRDAEDSLYHVSKAILKNDQDCGDAVQEALLTAYEKLYTLKEDKYFKTWLTRILINECYSIIKKKKRLVPYEEYLEDAGAWETDKYTDLYLAIQALPEELRVLVTLYYIEGFSVKETGEILHLAQGTVKSRLHKARALLRDSLQEEEATC